MNEDSSGIESRDLSERSNYEDTRSSIAESLFVRSVNLSRERKRDTHSVVRVADSRCRTEDARERSLPVVLADR